MDIALLAELAALGGLVTWQRHEQLRALRADGIPEVGSVAVGLSGYSSVGKFYNSSAGQCFVVRYVAASCRYCEADSGRWADFAKGMDKLGCESFEIAPSPSALPFDGTPWAHSLAYIGVGWFRSGIQITVDPTTIVFDHVRRVVWARVGRLGLSDGSAAAAALLRLDRGSGENRR